MGSAAPCKGFQHDLLVDYTANVAASSLSRRPTCQPLCGGRPLVVIHVNHFRSMCILSAWLGLRRTQIIERAAFLGHIPLDALRNNFNSVGPTRINDIKLKIQGCRLFSYAFSLPGSFQCLEAELGAIV